MPSEARLESHQVCSFATMPQEGLGGGAARGTYKYIQMRQLEGPRSGLGGSAARGTYKYIQMRQLEGPRSRKVPLINNIPRGHS